MSEPHRAGHHDHGGASAGPRGADPERRVDPRRRRGVPDRLLLPPAPSEPRLAAHWRSLPFERRRALAHASRRGTRGLDDEEAELVRGLAQRRVATAWRLHLAALVLGWLVLMTLWGFGRSTFPDREASWLGVGLAAGCLVWLVAAIAVARRVRRARGVADESGSDGV